MKLDALRRDSRVQRRILLWVIGLAIALIALAAIALTLLAVFSYRNNGDRLAAAAAISGGAAMLLAVVASLVALLAYAVSTGSPDLQLRIHFDFSRNNNPAFRAEAQENGRFEAARFKQTIGRISLRNTSGYSANNPAIIVRLQGMAFLPESHLSDNWVSLDFVTTVGCIAIQWDGGPQYSIHGNSTRMLPSIDLDRLYHRPNMAPPAFIFEILAEGYRREVTVPVTFKVEGQPEPPEDASKKLPEWI